MNKRVLGLTPTERLLSRYEVDDRGCWNWTWACDRGGYGKFKIGRKGMAASRASYLLLVGDIPAGMMVCHTCDNPKCINPSHLFLGTNADNTRDRDRKGRASRASRRGRRLTPEAAIAIRTSTEPPTVVAPRFGVSIRTIADVRNGRTWRRVG